MSIKDLPILERPREKAFRYGIESLSDVELLAIFIASGYKEHSARDIAYDILKDYNSLYYVSKMSRKDFLKYKGISKVKALTLEAIFEINKRCLTHQLEIHEQDESNNDYIIDKYQNILKDEQQELLILVMFNIKKRIIAEKTLYKGSNKNVPFSFKDIFRILIENNAKSFYIIHNHPEGSASPSQEDISLTTEIIKEVKKIGCKLIDHLIISNHDTFSFRNH